MNNDQATTTTSIPETGLDSLRHDDVVTIVLTADNHLGYTGSSQHPGKREERQQRLRQALQQATDFAIVQGVDLFIQAGDLFDTPQPDERDRSFVAARLAQLKQAGVKVFALGGAQDTPGELHSRQPQNSEAGQTLSDDQHPAPQLSYARLGALHYFPPLASQQKAEVAPVLLKIRDLQVGLCGVGVVAGQEGDPLARFRVESEIGRATIPLLLLHAPIEGVATGSSLLDTRTQVRRSSIEKQSVFKYILAGYHHIHTRAKIGQTEVIVAGATQHVDFSMLGHKPGFVFLGLAADGVRWCNHIDVDSFAVQSLVIQTEELWPLLSQNASASDQSTEDQGPSNAASLSSTTSPTDLIIERMRPLCSKETMLQVRLEGELTRSAYHQLDLNRIRRFGEEHCFTLAIDDSALSVLPEQEVGSLDSGERFSPREELITLAGEWIAAAGDEQEQQALRTTRDELLLAMDEIKSRR